MIKPEDLYCFNPRSGKRDGNFCRWEGAEKCLKCQAADRIAELEQERDNLKATLIKAGCLADFENWPDRFPLVSGKMRAALGGDDG